MEDNKLNLPEKIIKMQAAGKAAASILQDLISHIRIGMNTLEIDTLAVELMEKASVTSPTKNYSRGLNGKPFPGSICVWKNDVVTHGIPSKDVIFEDGDLVTVDVAVSKDGWCADNARSFLLGTPTDKAQKLLEVTTEALNIAVQTAKTGNTIGDIGYAVQTFVEAEGFNVVRDLVGHTIGKKMHEEPMIPAYGKANTGMILERYHTIAMDTMINEGSPDVIFDKEDGWTVRTKDGKLSCIMEDTFYVDDKGGVVLTRA
jgi:methionyl aminopeptidase